MSEQANTQPPRWPGIWTLVRDVLGFFGGWTLAFMEASRPEIRESVLVFCLTAIAAPAGGVALGLLSQRRAGTPEEPSSPQPQAASPSSPQP